MADHLHLRYAVMNISWTSRFRTDQHDTFALRAEPDVLMNQKSDASSYNLNLCILEAVLLSTTSMDLNL